MIKVKVSYETPEERAKIMKGLDLDFVPVSVKSREDAKPYKTMYVLAKMKRRDSRENGCSSR